MSVEVRFATDADAPEIRALLEDASLTVYNTPYDHFDPSTWVAVTEESRVVGALTAVLGYPLSMVMNIVLAPEYRNLRIGAALLSAFEAHLRKLGYPTWVGCTKIDLPSSDYIKSWPGIMHLGVAHIWGKVL